MEKQGAILSGFALQSKIGFLASKMKKIWAVDKFCQEILTKYFVGYIIKPAAGRLYVPAGLTTE